jgi:hypothetical protein
MTSSLSHQPGAAARSALVPASSDDPTTVAERARIAQIVERALSAMEPMVERIVDDASLSAEHALHVVVMDPTRDARTPFDASILVERSYGDPSAWKADYASGAQPCYDHAVAAVAIQLFEAGLAHERVAAATEEVRQ